MKVIQELLRHAFAKMTLDTYSQALTRAKRAAPEQSGEHDSPEINLYRRCTATFLTESA
jgi:hypothetical protein